MAAGLLQVLLQVRSLPFQLRNVPVLLLAGVILVVADGVAHLLYHLIFL